MPEESQPTKTNDAPAGLREAERKPAIEAVNLTKVFGGRTCVDNLSIRVNAGELYALLGDNGAGKTTTINMLTTLLSPDGGQVRVCGIDALSRPEPAKECFGVVSQDVAIYQELTGYENLGFVADLYRMPREQAHNRIELLLERAGLSDRADDLAGEYSMGMQRKLAIATAILHEPKVLFMDEPTVGLDPASRRQIWESLKELRAHGVTILLTTHYLEEAQLLADRIGIIRRGKMVVEGNITELRSYIAAIRGVSVSLSGAHADQDLANKSKTLPEQLSSSFRYDALRNTIWVSQPQDMALSEVLGTVVAWLDDAGIAYFDLGTSEPSLEEIFLAISAGQATQFGRSGKAEA